MFNNTRIKLPTIAITIVVLSCLVIDFSLKSWEKLERVIEHDIHSYYAYLPAAFIYNDIELKKSDYFFDEDRYYLFWPNTTETGGKAIKTNMGMSVLYAPFFFVAHGYAVLSDYPENGFSEPYKILLLFSAIFYLFIGLDFLRKILSHYRFSDIHISITLLLVGLGTNLLAYSSQSAPMSHTYSFCLIAIFIHYTIKWYQDYSIKITIILGLLLGLISLVRATNILILLFFILYGISNFSELKQRLILYRKECFLLNLMFLFTCLVWVPQFMYWKTVSGEYLYYSYTGERFFFNNPRIMEGLFSFRKGWFVYTPIMAFAVIGIFFLRDTLKELRLATIVFLISIIYIIFSWWCWWYGGSYSQRSLVDSYALMAIPLAAFVKFISEKKVLYKILFCFIGLFLIWLNIFQTYQFEYHSLHWDGMTKELYFKQFGKMAKVSDYDILVSWPNYEEAKKGNSADAPPVKEGEIATVFNGNQAISIQTVHLQAMNGKYVCADGAHNFIVNADKEKANAWETFTLICFPDNKCAIRSYTNSFFSAEIHQQSQVTANRIGVDAWELFTIERLYDNHITLNAVNGKYLSVDEKTLQLFANSSTVGSNEKFKLIVLENQWP